MNDDIEYPNAAIACANCGEKLSIQVYGGGGTVYQGVVMGGAVRLLVVHANTGSVGCPYTKAEIIERRKRG